MLWCRAHVVAFLAHFSFVFCNRYWTLTSTITECCILALIRWHWVKTTVADWFWQWGILCSGTSRYYFELTLRVHFPFHYCTLCLNSIRVIVLYWLYYRLHFFSNFSCFYCDHDLFTLHQSVSVVSLLTLQHIYCCTVTLKFHLTLK